VFATISGAHLYGFASPDSDVDLRGAFMLPARVMLGLHPPRETLTIEDKSQIDLDWVAHDIRKFARMLTNHNGYVLEQLFSPLVVVASPAFDELRELARGCVTRPTVRHYQGFARGRRKRLYEPAPTVKHLLYAYCSRSHSLVFVRGSIWVEASASNLMDTPEIHAIAIVRISRV
jgi:predicted nucleotidyltransferase